MFFDSLGKCPSDYTEMRPNARCPECGGLLYKRGGGSSKVVEHWAHNPNPDRVCFAESVSQGESHWHLSMKKAFRDAGFDVEKTIEVNGKKYRADAINGKIILEFVNSISNSYEQKTIDLIDAGYDLHWIFNGSEFSEDSICGLELPGKQGRFARRAQGLNASAWVYDYGQIIKCSDTFANRPYGITSASRMVKFLKNGFTNWMWARLHEKRTLEEFMNCEAYTAMPICYNPEDTERVVLI